MFLREQLSFLVKKIWMRNFLWHLLDLKKVAKRYSIWLAIESFDFFVCLPKICCNNYYNFFFFVSKHSMTESE